MSSIRLYLLDVLSEQGPMYGHQLKLFAEKESIKEWTDISVGALYGALKRMSSEGLIEPLRSEHEGAYPERQVYAITEAGRAALSKTKRDAILQVEVHSDLFDLALSRLGRGKLESFPFRELLDTRIARLRALAEEADADANSASRSLSAAESIVLGHRAARLKSELQWHVQLHDNLPHIIANESALRDK